MFFSVFAVALLTEGVDRNTVKNVPGPELGVALLTAGVDRNLGFFGIFVDNGGRPPHGGRG